MVVQDSVWLKDWLLWRQPAQAKKLLIQNFIARLWWGKPRNVFEPFARRWIGNSERVISGPLQNAFFSGGLAHLLGVYEIHVQKVLVEVIRKGMIVYDIGANNGYFSLLASKLVGSQGKVYAFEPFPPNLDKLLANVSRNNCANVFSQPLAVSDSTGKAQLYIEASSATPTLISSSRASTLEISQVALDDFVMTHEHPDAIKVDVEGMEVQVLKGAKKLLEEKRPAWVIEVHSESNEMAIKAILHTYQYKIIDLIHPRGESKLYPKNIYTRGDIA